MTMTTCGGLRILFAAALAMMAVLLVGCADVSQESFDRINVGMEIREVQNIMGTDGKSEEVVSRSISAGGIAGTVPSAHRDMIWTWESGRQRIIVHTRDGKVTQKFKEGF